MKKMLYGVLVSFLSVMYLYTLTAAAAPPVHANGKAGFNKPSTENSGFNANTAGPYDPYGVGQPSGNGNGDGNSTGKPCAGCVGNADSKNPPGQLPGPDDANNGYECDGNKGIAQGNPAHSFCKPATTTSSTSTTTTTTTTTIVPVTTTSSTSTTIPTVAKDTPVSPNKLPVTGGDISLLMGVGSGLALAGTAITRLARRK